MNAHASHRVVGIWVPDDSCVMGLGAKGLSGTNWKDGVRGSIPSVINVNLVRK